MAKSITTGTFLQRRGESWSVRVRVPPSLQAIAGNTHIRKALGTKSKPEAERLKWKAVAEIKAYLEQLRRAPAPAPPERPEGNPRAWAENIRSLREEGDHDAADNLEMIAIDKAQDWEETDARAKRNAVRKLREEGDGKQADALERLPIDQAASKWFRSATTAERSLDELVEQWLTGASYKEQTKATYRRAFVDLRASLGLTDGDLLFPADITDAVAVGFVSTYLPAQGYSSKSIATRLGALSSFWVFCQQQLATPLGRNPWTGHRVSSQKTITGLRSRQAPEDERAYTESELVAILHGTERSRKWKVYPRVRDLLLLGLYTGARLNELCSLLVKDVSIANEGAQSAAIISIREGKTAAPTRTSAVTHWAVLQVLERRIAGKKPDAQLFEELRPGGPDGKLSWTASKSFTRYRRACGCPDGTDFHSLRRTFLTLMEHGGVDYVAVARFAGHQVPTLMHMVYSAGASREALIKVAEAARYAPTVEKAVAAVATQ